ncbi:MAG TPA: 1-deoxy-D-xylulose-5-phosphate reductoisomerase [Planctomycetaceae bacterium]|nr:1-deoxy-D-xylulose-5-phosphate reductoisomerase [Planctomycetaceae bacterium]
MKQIVVLGSTGSIGTSTLDVLAAHPERLALFGIAARSSWRQLSEQTHQFRPRYAVLTDERLESEIDRSAFHSETELIFGDAGIEKIVTAPEVQTVVSGIVGAAGLRGTWAALEAHKDVALANKETLVVAGPLIVELARKNNCRLLPVDSEHSALFQAMQCGRVNEISKLILTASGGPFRGRSAEELKSVTREMALDHPTWNMGPKITIDSATMMNKALEVIEARWLFDLPPEQIDVVIHPQSIVHSMIEFTDGSTIAHLSPPDMKLPIQYALSYPERWSGISPTMDWSRARVLDFEPPDREAFPALDLGYEVARLGGTAGAVLNAANEVAVERFLAGDLEFCQIPALCGEILSAHNYQSNPSLDDLLALDAWARKEIRQWQSC